MIKEIANFSKGGSFIFFYINTINYISIFIINNYINYINDYIINNIIFTIYLSEIFLEKK